MKWPNITGKKARIGAMLIVMFLALGLAIPIVGGFFFGGEGSTGIEWFNLLIISVFYYWSRGV